MRTRYGSKDVLFPSPTWWRMLKLKDMTNANFHKLIYKRDSRSWFNNWLGEAPLADLVEGELQQPGTMIAEIYSNEDGWNSANLRQLLPSPLVQRVQAHKMFLSNQPDTYIWKESSSGRFTLSSASGLDAFCYCLRHSTENHGNVFAPTSVVVIAILKIFARTVEYSDRSIHMLVHLGSRQLNYYEDHSIRPQWPIRNVHSMFSAIVVRSPLLIRHDQASVITASSLSIYITQPAIRRSLAVSWKKPTYGIKMNVDGSLFGNPEPSRIGGIVRDRFNRVIIGFLKSLQYNAMNIEAEAIALLHDLRLCDEQGIRHVHIETDPPSLYEIILGKVATPWSIDVVAIQI
ncbi:hypothetical protein ACH5RR_032567 [Cinchona calisaya]|uniref:RNase H type-1 domain-containing protein n=1 Tax=Cinchona calisaya TaxID=153742 RepID=A0ABD2YIG8_9GENT